MALIVNSALASDFSCETAVAFFDTCLAPVVMPDYGVTSFDMEVLLNWTHDNNNQL